MNNTQPSTSPRPHVRVEAGAQIAAPAAVVYRLIADYEQGHPRIVPPQYFRNLKVVRGGYGAGTEITFEMRAFGSVQHCRATITEPEPGRVLIETDAVTGAETRFEVASEGSAASFVRFVTTIPTRSGVLGWVERAVTRAFLKRVYAAELARLGEVAVAELGVTTAAA
jgi:hypothetical protein